MTEPNRYDNSTWDRFFDFIAEPVELMAREEVQQELERRGIDVTNAVSRVRKAVQLAASDKGENE